MKKENTQKIEESKVMNVSMATVDENETDGMFCSRINRLCNRNFIWWIGHRTCNTDYFYGS